jgi:tRNA-specific 2-thiouridylase
MKAVKLNKKVFVGMSGGVDSSVSAALLKKAGYDITGVFIKAWHPPFLECSWKEDRRDAMHVAALLDIPFITLDLEKEYKKQVIDSMLADYKKGITSNPDVLCNEKIKFGIFFNKAKKKGADFIATGHYAQVRKTKGKYALIAGHDTNKDQTYFLYKVNQKHLPYTLFPIGHLEKPIVRKIAKEFNLPTADKKDSQGLCFVGQVDFKSFLSRYIKPKEGIVLNTKGEVVGTHDGAWLYTIGERHGFTITKKTPHDLPFYIVSKNVKKNTLTVAEKQDEANFYKKEVAIKNINWTLGTAPAPSKIYTARIRYRQPLQKCKLKKIGKNFVLIFQKPQRAVTPGQSLVLYDGKICLGGGIIQ